MHGEHIHKSIAFFISQMLKRRAEILLVAVEAVGLGIGAHTGYQNYFNVGIFLLYRFNNLLRSAGKGRSAGRSVVHAEAEYQQVVA